MAASGAAVKKGARGGGKEVQNAECRMQSEPRGVGAGGEWQTDSRRDPSAPLGMTTLQRTARSPISPRNAERGMNPEGSGQAAKGSGTREEHAFASESPPRRVNMAPGPAHVVRAAPPGRLRSLPRHVPRRARGPPSPSGLRRGRQALALHLINDRKEAASRWDADPGSGCQAHSWALAPLSRGVAPPFYGGVTGRRLPFPSPFPSPPR